MFEVFAPSEYLLHARFGPHYVGIEYQVPDVDQARAEVLARGMRVIRELGVAIHVHPAEAFGVAWEFFGRSFHDDPPPVEYVEPLKPSEYWREHPLGYTGLKRYSVAVADLESATEFFEDFLGAAVIYEEARPAVAARAVGFDSRLTPSPSSSARSGRAPSSGTWPATVTASAPPCSPSADLDQARRHFAERGVTLTRRRAGHLRRSRRRTTSACCSSSRSDGRRSSSDMSLEMNAADEARGVAVLLHPHPHFGGNRFHPFIEALFRRLPDIAVSAIRFDFTSAEPSAPVSK